MAFYCTASQRDLVVKGEIVSMRNEADRLLEDLEYIRSNAGSTGPGHPKFKRWLSDVRTHLGREGTSKELKRFEQLETVRGGPEMWSRDEPAPADLRRFRSDLTKVEAILKETQKHAGSSAESPAHQRIVDLFFTKEEERHKGQ